MKRTGTGFLFLLLILLPTTLRGQTNQLQAKFLPPGAKRLLFVGQDLGAIGGTPGHSNGYFEHVSKHIGGVTTYTSFPDLHGLIEPANWGAGDINAEALLKSPHFEGSAISIGLYLVDQLPLINSGKHDSTIDRLAKWIHESKRPVFLRIGYEFDGYWNHYDPEEYRSAYRRIVTRIRESGTDNFASVWQSSTSPVDDAVERKQENIADWYPGDDVVDWCGLSWFLASRKQHELSDELLQFARQHHKPVMICESACQAYDLGAGTKRNFNTMIDGAPGENRTSKSPDEIWGEWFRPYFEYIDKNDDVIRAVAWINCNWDKQPMWGPPYNEGYWGDTRLQASPQILKRWRRQVSSDTWLHRLTLPESKNP